MGYQLVTSGLGVGYEWFEDGLQVVIKWVTTGFASGLQVGYKWVTNVLRVGY